jgi:hypothetical protein
MKPKKPAKKLKDIILKSDKSFDELIEDAWNDKVFKKDLIEPAVMLLLNQNLEQATKKPAKKATKKAAPKKKAAKKKVVKKSK